MSKPRDVVPMVREPATDPTSLLHAYRQWRKAETSRAAVATAVFRQGLLALRVGLPSGDAIFRGGSGLPALAPPQLEHGEHWERALSSALWRRQTIVNQIVAQFVNAWPHHAQSSAARAWLDDDLAPLMSAPPLAGASHRGLLAPAARLVKTAAARAAAARHREVWGELQDVNRLLYEALNLLAGPALPELEARALAQRLLDAASDLPARGPSAAFTRQLDFDRAALASVAALVLPGEGALELVYPTWLSTHEAERAARYSTSDDKTRVSVVLAGDAAQNFDELMGSLRCQSGEWECFRLTDAQAPSLHLAPQPVTLQQLRAQLTGELVLFITEPVVFAPFALAALRAHARSSAAHVWYSDHDVLTDTGEVIEPLFTPGWSPDMFNEVAYTGEVIALRADAFKQLTGERERLGNGDVTRLLMNTPDADIARVPEVLWHRRSERHEAQHLEVVRELLAKRELPGRVERAGKGWRVRYPIAEAPLVSIIVPFKDKPELLHQLITSFEQHETWPRVQFVLVSNNSKNEATQRYLAGLSSDRFTVAEWNHPFNYQTINNVAVRRWARGAYLLFLNNDVTWNAGGTIEELVMHAQRPEVGAVGVNLKYPNGRLQHAGVAVGPGGFAAHPFCGCLPNVRWTAFGLPSWTRNPSAVTAACVMVRRDVFDEVGGFDEEIVVSGGDVDLSLRIGARGYRIINTPHVDMTHHESATRAGDVIPDGDAWLGYQRFSRLLKHGDPGYNPNLTLVSQDCLPRLDPRTADELARTLLTNVLESSRRVLGQ